LKPYRGEDQEGYISRGPDISNLWANLELDP
jgi:hypothetical protein